MSSRNSSESFDLRCLVREQMTAWIQQNHPSAFPTTRFAARPDTTINLQQPTDLQQSPDQKEHLHVG